MARRRVILWRTVLTRQLLKLAYLRIALIIALPVPTAVAKNFSSSQENAQAIAAVKTGAPDIAGTESRAQRQIKYHRQRSLFSGLYDLVVRTLTHAEIQKELAGVYDDANGAARRTYALQLPGVELGRDPDRRGVKQGLNKGATKAFTKELPATFAVLREWTKKFDFSFDLGNLFRKSRPPAARKTRYGLARRADGDNSGPAGTLVAVAPTTDAAATADAAASGDDEHHYQFGKFSGGIQADVVATAAASEDQEKTPTVLFNFQQYDGLYRMQLPIKKGVGEDDLVHEVMVPILDELVALRKVDHQGGPLQSTVRYAGRDQTGQCDIFYLHQEEQYGSELKIKQSIHEFTLKSRIPAPWNLQLNSFRSDGAEYSVGYVRPL